MSDNITQTIIAGLSGISLLAAGGCSPTQPSAMAFCSQSNLDRL